MLTLNQLEIFYVVAQSRTFQEAADSLYISQPAVSQQIKTLESALGNKLIERNRRGISLTPAGRTLFDYATEILRIVAEAEQATTNVNNLSKGNTQIGATPNISGYLLPEWIRTFRERYPNLTPSVITDVTGKLITEVLNRHHDIAFLEGEIHNVADFPHLGVLVLESVHQVVVVGTNHDWWQRESVNIADISTQAMVIRQKSSQTRIWLDGLFTQYNIKPQITGEYDNPTALKHAVSAGNCITILPAYAVQHELNIGLMKTLPVTDANLSRDIKLIWDNRRVFSPVTHAFLEHLAPQYPPLKSLL